VTDRTARGAYLTIAQALRTEVQDGTIPPGQALPSEAAMATRFGVARNTLRAALTILADEGLVYSEPARGWFAGSRPEVSAKVDLASIVSTLRAEISELPVDQQFTTAPKVAERFNVALHVARQALAMLGTEGLIESKHGKGWFVSSKS
jgi:DNA-binding GntR family transcriptional regulator